MLRGPVLFGCKPRVSCHASRRLPSNILMTLASQVTCFLSRQHSETDRREPKNRKNVCGLNPTPIFSGSRQSVQGRRRKHVFLGSCITKQTHEFLLGHAGQEGTRATHVFS